MTPIKPYLFVISNVMGLGYNKNVVNTSNVNGNNVNKRCT